MNTLTAVGVTPEEKTCGNCTHARPVLQSLGAAVRCKAAPPVMVITPTRQGPAAQAMFPIVPARDPESVCARWWPAPAPVPDQEKLKAD